MIDTNDLKICSNCILPETFPGIKFDEKGLCNHCQRDQKKSGKKGIKSDFKNKFDSLIKEKRDKAPVYDVLMAYSGGKDSSYTLKILTEKHGLRILCLTYDNHFISDRALENIKAVTQALNIDSMIFTVPWQKSKKYYSLTAQKDIFPTATLLRASSVCTTCISIVKNIVLKTALEMSIPLVAYGWSPGQAPIQSSIMQTNPALFKQGQKLILKAYPDDMQDEIKHYFLPEEYYKRFENQFPVNIHPLAFFEYDETMIFKELKNLNWKEPDDTDTNSSNCLLNAFANQCHINRLGFHPYVWENANMVRQGILDRQTAIERIYTEQDSQQVEYAKEKLGL